jgi:hypothetical protein
MNDCAEACYESETGPVTVLSAPRLLLTQEQIALSELASGIQQRLGDLEMPGL